MLIDYEASDRLRITIAFHSLFDLPQDLVRQPTGQTSRETGSAMGKRGGPERGGKSGQIEEREAGAGRCVQMKS